MYYDGSCHDSWNTDWIGERWLGEWGRAIRTRAWNDVAPENAEKETRAMVLLAGHTNNVKKTDATVPSLGHVNKIQKTNSVIPSSLPIKNIRCSTKLAKIVLHHDEIKCTQSNSSPMQVTENGITRFDARIIASTVDESGTSLNN
ncbi:hypothetical protein ACQ4PT_057857 [Festuca glaucescens]